MKTHVICHLVNTQIYSVIGGNTALIQRVDCGQCKSFKSEIGAPATDYCDSVTLICACIIIIII